MIKQILNKNKAFSVAGFFLIITLLGCSKGGGGSSPTPTPAEETLKVSLSAASIETSPSSSFTFNVNVLSKLPANGVSIKVDVKREDNGVSVYNVTGSSSIASNSFTISPLPPGQIYCLANITVTSASTSSNTWTGSFRVLWK